MNRRSGRGTPWRVLGAAVLAAAWAAPTALPAAGAAPYSLAVDAMYRVDLAGHSVSVTLAATFRNTTPDRPGTHSLYRTIPIPLQPGASSVTARDTSGALAVSTRPSADQTLAVVTLRTGLRYGRSATVSIAYRLRDGAPHIRVKPDVVVLPLWAFGTSGSVGVRVPASLVASVSGAAMTSATVSGQTVLSSGPLKDPGGWQALLAAFGDPIYTTVNRNLPLSGGTVELRVRSWSDDPAWGSRTLSLALRALPALQAVIGLPYAASTPVVITEALPVGTGGFTEPVPGAQEIKVAFDASPFVVLHELAHVWIDGTVGARRWIQEGLASQAAAQVAPGLKVALPFDPTQEAARHTAAAVPLDAWYAASGSATQGSGATDAWAYAASWAFIRQVAQGMGTDRLWVLVRDGVAGATGYRTTVASQASDAAADPSNRDPLDSRRFLDLLEGQGPGQAPAGMDAAFAKTILSEGDAALLARRATARKAYAALLTAAGGWPAPDGIRGAMEAWSFDEAQSLMTAASGWLAQRDRLLADARGLGLSPPDRLATAWRMDGAGPTAVAELRAEQSLVDAFASARATVGNPNPVERLGLLGGPMPSDLLAQASGRFTGGDLTGSAAAIERAMALAAGAQANGVVRLGVAAAAVAVAVFGVALATYRFRRWVRRRRASPEVAQPPIG
jgi:hypothetical protein